MRLILPTVLAALASMSSAQPTVLAEHTGDLDPVGEGFVRDVSGLDLSGPEPGDLGEDAYAVGGTGMARFSTGNLDAPTQSELLDRGWRMLARVRVAQAPDLRGLVAINLENVGGRRYDMNLGIGADGETFVRLNETILTVPQLTGVGPTHTIVGSGSSYVTVELVYDPDEQSADLFVNGDEVLSDYAGHTTFVRPLGFYFAAYQNHVGHFAEVRFEILAGPCSEADLAEPIGILDFNDVVLYLTLFADGDPCADLADAPGVLDFNDVVAYLTAFAAGCP